MEINYKKKYLKYKKKYLNLKNVLLGGAATVNPYQIGQIFYKQAENKYGKISKINKNSYIITILYSGTFGFTETTEQERIIKSVFKREWELYTSIYDTVKGKMGNLHNFMGSMIKSSTPSKKSTTKADNPDASGQVVIDPETTRVVENATRIQAEVEAEAAAVRTDATKLQDATATLGTQFEDPNINNELLMLESTVNNESFKEILGKIKPLLKRKTHIQRVVILSKYFKKTQKDIITYQKSSNIGIEAKNNIIGKILESQERTLESLNKIFESLAL